MLLSHIASHLLDPLTSNPSKLLGGIENPESKIYDYLIPISF
jgi:hypothetical protein